MQGSFCNLTRNAKVLYGDDSGLPPAEHVGLFCGQIAGTAEKIAHDSLDSGTLTAEELHSVLSYLFSKEEPSHAN